MYSETYPAYCGGQLFVELHRETKASILAAVKKYRYDYAHFIVVLSQMERSDDGENQNTKYGAIFKSLGFKMVARSTNPNTGNLCYMYVATKEQLKFPGEKKLVKKKKAIKKDYW